MNNKISSRKGTVIVLLLGSILSILIGIFFHKKEENNRKLEELSNACERNLHKCREMIIAFKNECFANKNGYRCFRLSNLAQKNDIHFKGIKLDVNSLRTLGCIYGYQESCSSNYYFKMDDNKRLSHWTCRIDKSKCEEIKVFLEGQCAEDIDGACYELASLMREANLNNVSFQNQKISDPNQILKGSCYRGNILSCNNLEK